MSCSPWSHKELGTTEVTKYKHKHIHLALSFPLCYHSLYIPVHTVILIISTCDFLFGFTCLQQIDPELLEQELSLFYLIPWGL